MQARAWFHPRGIRVYTLCCTLGISAFGCKPSTAANQEKSSQSSDAITSSDVLAGSCFQNVNLKGMNFKSEVCLEIYNLPVKDAREVCEITDPERLGGGTVGGKSTWTTSKCPRKGVTARCLFSGKGPFKNLQYHYDKPVDCPPGSKELPADAKSGKDDGSGSGTSGSGSGSDSRDGAEAEGPGTKPAHVDYLGSCYWKKADYDSCGDTFGDSGSAKHVAEAEHWCVTERGIGGEEDKPRANALWSKNPCLSQVESSEIRNGCHKDTLDSIGLIEQAWYLRSKVACLFGYEVTTDQAWMGK